MAVGLGDVRGLWLKSCGLLLFIDLVGILERMWLYLLSAQGPFPEMLIDCSGILAPVTAVSQAEGPLNSLCILNVSHTSTCSFST